MRIYNQENTAGLVEIVCNKCGKKITMAKGVPQKEWVHVEKNWGYFSRKDGVCHAFDICEECYDEWIAGFAKPVMSEENLELF